MASGDYMSLRPVVALMWMGLSVEAIHHIGVNERLVDSNHKMLPP